MSPPLGLVVGLLGRGDVPAQPVQLGALVEGSAHRRVTGRPGQQLARLRHLLDRLGPGSVQLHDLGPVHQALPAVGHQLRLGRAPSGQCRRPCLRASHVEDLLACLDHGAVGDSPHDRRDLAGRDRDHHFVQSGHALDGLAKADQGLTLAEAAHRDQIRVSNRSPIVLARAKVACAVAASPAIRLRSPTGPSR